MTIVDHQTHWLPPAAAKLYERRGYPRVERLDDGYLIELAEGAALRLPEIHADLDAQLAAAEEAGIDVLVSSPNLLGEVLDLPAEEAAELLMATNDCVAAAQDEHRGRFLGLALLPMQDTETALRVLDHAHGRGLAAVCMPPTIAGAPIATDETLPVFRRLEELGMPLVLHPEARRRQPSPAASRAATLGVGWMCATTLAALSLIESGTLERCPGLVVLHPHLGGVLPWIHGRVNLMCGDGDGPTVAEQLRAAFYVDSVSATPGALAFAAEVYGAERILFASDYPFMPLGPARDFVEQGGGATTTYANRLPGLPVGP